VSRPVQIGPVQAGLGLFVLAAAVLVLLAALGVAVMPSYLAAWLCWMALPLGALPLVILLELIDARDLPLLAALRGLLPMLPLGAVLALPMLITAAPFHYAGDMPHLALWMAPLFFRLRMVAMLVVWSLFALAFRVAHEGAPRRGWGIAGLLLHLVMGSIAAVDWVMSLEPGINSSAIGLLLISSQMGMAMCVAAVGLAMAHVPEPERPVPTTAQMLRFGPIAPRMSLTVKLMIGVLGVWVFLQFTQYLSVWSANLPDEVVWYQRRGLGFGTPVIWFGFTAAIIAFLALTPYRLARRPAIVASVASMLLLVHLLEMLWLVTPAFRDSFSLALPDLTAVLGLAGLAVAVALMLGMVPPRRSSGVAA
jgi:hypothetical protein